MGNIWTDVHASKTKKLEEHVNKVDTCKKAVAVTRKMIQEVIDIVSSTSKWENTEDYKRYRLFPGQTIFYRNILGNYNNLHPAIYVYEGLILEIGSGPKACKGSTSFVTSFFGLSSLKEFKAYGKKSRKSHTWKVVTEKDHQKNVMLARLRRSKKTVGPTPFRIFSRNCQQITFEVGFGQKGIPKDSKNVKITRGKI